MTTSIRTASASARAAALLAALALGACATMDEQACRGADWEALGHAEGARGAPARQIDAQRKACAGHGVTLQEGPWRAGYARGIEEFCTPRGGYLAGRSGSRVDAELCAGKLQAEAFKSALAEGKEIATLVSELRTLRSALQEYEMAVLANERGSDRAQLEQRMAAIRDAIGVREWEVDRRDGEYSATYGVPPLSAAAAR
jgi:hypothetical protein